MNGCGAGVAQSSSCPSHNVQTAPEAQRPGTVHIRPTPRNRAGKPEFRTDWRGLGGEPVPRIIRTAGPFTQGSSPEETNPCSETYVRSSPFTRKSTPKRSFFDQFEISSKSVRDQFEISSKSVRNQFRAVFGLTRLAASPQPPPIRKVELPGGNPPLIRKVELFGGKHPPPAYT